MQSGSQIQISRPLLFLFPWLKRSFLNTYVSKDVKLFSGRMSFSISKVAIRVVVQGIISSHKSHLDLMQTKFQEHVDRTWPFKMSHLPCQYMRGTSAAL